MKTAVPVPFLFFCILQLPESSLLSCSSALIWELPFISWYTQISWPCQWYSMIHLGFSLYNMLQYWGRWRVYIKFSFNFSHFSGTCCHCATNAMEEKALYVLKWMEIHIHFSDVFYAYLYIYLYISIYFIHIFIYLYIYIYLLWDSHEGNALKWVSYSRWVSWHRNYLLAAMRVIAFHSYTGYGWKRLVVSVTANMGKNNINSYIKVSL